ncbi:unnamed protein product [Phaedon cochleariae]|uniref:Fatty acyl-CoA reductase n=1 Tax=Phaedon cochleariae TaxID=80249 RepID=A0A9P0GIE5_PHACE|nr:unnamed protein product [Phaedon cochleariae]
MEASVDQSEIQQFYKNQTALVTGATGFLGKLVLEKLLRTVNLKHVYLLMREKNGVDAETRCAEMFDSLAFGNLKRNDQDFFKKVSIILGDVEKADLGLSDYDRNLIVTEVNCVFHCGTDNQLGAPLRRAVRANVRATRDLLELAKQMEELKSFVFVSSVYSNFPLYEIHEKFYAPKETAENLIDLVDKNDEAALETMENSLLGEWPDTYTFTMCAAEDLIKREGNCLPISIIRPSMILPANEEPMTGFVDEMSGLQADTVARAMGVSKVNYYKNGTLDVVPVDHVVSLIIASGWYSALQRMRMTRGDVPNAEVTIYHCISSQEKPITSDEWMGITHTEFRDVPTNKMIQLPISFKTGCYYNYKLLIFLLHTCMAFLCDTGLKLVGKTPCVMAMYKTLHRTQELLHPYLLREWYFSNDNAQKLLKRMSFMDRELYNFDILSLNWQTYLTNYARGVRVYLLKDPMSTLKDARRKQTRKLVTQLVFAGFLVTIIYVISKFVLFRIILKLPIF